MTVRNIFHHIVLALGTLVLASCASDLDNAIVTIDSSNIRFVVGDFPAFGESSTRAIGTEDPGKTEWAEGDELLLEVGNTSLGNQYATVTFKGGSWVLTNGELAYKEGDPAYIPHVYYAPNYRWVSGELALKEGKVAGTDECIEGSGRITNDGQEITVSFSDAKRNYSRLRIATIPNEDITVMVTHLTPIGSSEMKRTFYALRSDEKGNAYLYDKFGNGSNVSVNCGGYILADYTFREASTDGASYALDATVVSLEGKSSEEIDQAITKVTREVKAGKTDLKFRLAPDAGEDMFLNISFVIHRADNKGSINLTLMGCKVIPYLTFMSCNQLKSVVLPDVEEIGFSAFYDCSGLKKVVFGAPLIKVDGQEPYNGIFKGCATTGIDLVVSRKQKVMSCSQNGNYVGWTPSTDDYKYSTEYNESEFLGYKFKKVTWAWEVLW